ncbi:MAG: AAA family ATPase [Magnetococcales bacterium]|nr:AAA family ATPase [Magnetococcales bacterium]
MHIKYLEIQNFRRLKSVRIDLAKETTIFVGANNSGKTTAMVALLRFLVSKKFTIMDFTLSDWASIDRIGRQWIDSDQIPEMTDWEDFLPTMDVWLHVEKDEFSHVSHMYPMLDWEDGLLGIRLRLEPKKIEDLYQEFRDAVDHAESNNSKNKPVALWPTSLVHFLKRRMEGLFQLRAYCLDPKELKEPDEFNAKPQKLPEQSNALDRDFGELIWIDKIEAQRGFADFDSDHASSNIEAQKGEQSTKRKLSSQLKSYYDRHLDPEFTTGHFFKGCREVSERVDFLQ